MIDGLVLQFTTQELAGLLTTEITKAQARVDEYDRQLSVLDPKGEISDVTVQAFSNSSNSPFASVKDSRKRYKDKVQHMTFVRDHLPPNETIRIFPMDLENFGIIPHIY